LEIADFSSGAGMLNVSNTSILGNKGKSSLLKPRIVVWVVFVFCFVSFIYLQPLFYQQKSSRYSCN